MKKQVICLTTGIILAGMLSGCSPDVIEHQFHIYTQSSTEYATESINANEAMNNLENLFKSHGADIKINIIEAFPEDTIGNTDPLGSITTTTVTQQDIETWLMKGSDKDNYLCIYKACEKDTGLYGQLSIVSEHVNLLYQAFQSLGEDQWEHLKTNGSVYLFNSWVEVDGQYYIETVLTYR